MEGRLIFKMGHTCSVLCGLICGTLIYQIRSWICLQNMNNKLVHFFGCQALIHTVIWMSLWSLRTFGSLRTVSRVTSYSKPIHFVPSAEVSCKGSKCSGYEVVKVRSDLDTAKVQSIHYMKVGVSCPDKNKCKKSYTLSISKKNITL